MTTYRCPRCKTDTTRPITGRYGCPSCPPREPRKLDTSLPPRTRRTAPVRVVLPPLLQDGRVCKVCGPIDEATLSQHYKTFHKEYQ